MIPKSYALTRSRIARRTPVPEAEPTDDDHQNSFPQTGRSGRGGRRFKSCHSDHLSHTTDRLWGTIWGTKPSEALALVGASPDPVGATSHAICDLYPVLESGNRLQADQEAVRESGKAGIPGVYFVRPTVWLRRVARQCVSCIDEAEVIG